MKGLPAITIPPAVKRRLRDILIYGTVLLFIAALLAAGFFTWCIRMPGSSYTGPLAAPGPELQSLARRLEQHVRVLADEIGERHLYRRDSLEDAADYIEEQFEVLKYVPKSQMVNNKNFRNIVVDHYGRPNRERIIVVGAHYDTRWRTPGADDNASGVAALLEIARELRDVRLPVTIRFVAFVNEERPFFGGEDMGSRYSARRSREQGDDIIGMFSLEMLGYYSEQPRSQWLPRSLRKFYPRQGNFIAFVGNLVSRDLLVDGLSAFRAGADFPSEGLTAPQWLIPSIRRSDNSSFWSYGYPAVMITDTANLRNWNYHLATDTYDTLDYGRMARVVDGLAGMLQTLAYQY